MRWLPLILLVACRAPAPPPIPDAGMPPLEDAGAGCFSAFPEQLDFGEIEANSNAFTRLRITNRTSQLLQPRPDPIDAPFSFDGQDFDALSPSGSILITVRFNPTDGLLHFGNLAINAAGGCHLEVPVRGLGKGTFTVAPDLLDFGLLEPGESKSLQLSFSNTQRTPVMFDSVELRQTGTGPAPFTFDLAAPITIPAGGFLSTTVTATPPALDGYSATLVLSGPSTVFEVALFVVGGVPVAAVDRAVIDVPRMGFEPFSQPPSFVERTFRVKNVAPDAGTLLSALEMKPPFFTALNEDGGIVFDVLSSGFGRLMPGEDEEVVLRVTPPSVGPHRYQLVLTTNDPRNPELRLALDVNAVRLPPCTLDRPSSVVFTAARGGGSSGVVRFTNVSNVGCLLDGLRTGFGDFHITDGGTEQRELGPGEVHEVVLAGPDAGSRLSSLLLFHVLGPDTNVETIDLVAPP